MILQPAIKLVDFFRFISKATRHQSAHGEAREEAGGSTLFSTEKSQKFSETMAQLPQLALPDAMSWIKYWKNAGMFLIK